MSVRKRKWTTGKGEMRESWVVSYPTRDGKQHIETFERKRRCHAEIKWTWGGASTSR